MSRVDAAARMVESAIALGTRDGVGALTLQGIATVSGVSKALVLYHHQDKDALLLAVARRLVAKDVSALAEAAVDDEVLEAWRRVSGDAEHRAERALLVTLLGEASLRAEAPTLLSARAQAGSALAAAMLAEAGLRSRIANSLLGRVLVHHLDGIAVGTRGRSASSLEAELDATALALLGLGAE
jgi:AcrR family transcriptional regulator